MLNETSWEKVPVELRYAFDAADSILWEISHFRENMGIDTDHPGGEIGQEEAIDDLTRWLQSLDEIDFRHEELAGCLEEYGRYFAGANGDLVSLPLTEKEDPTRSIDGLSWHHVTLGVVEAFREDAHRAFSKCGVRLDSSGGDAGNVFGCKRNRERIVEQAILETEAFVTAYRQVVGDADVFRVAVAWDGIDRLWLRLEQEVMRAWGLWFPTDTDSEPDGGRAKKPPLEERNVAVREYIENHQDQNEKVTVREIQKALGYPHHRDVLETNAWKAYNAEWEKQYGKCRTRDGKGRRLVVANRVTDEEVRRLAEEQAKEDTDKIDLHDRL